MDMKTENLQVYGMVCYACTDILENTVKKVKGVAEAKVNYMMDVITIRYNEDITGLDDICKSALKAGYRLEEMAGSDEVRTRGRQLRRKRKKVLRTRILTVFVCSLLLNGLGNILSVWAKLFLATIVQFIVIKEFYQDAGNGIVNKKGNMSLLIAVGTTTGYLYSCYALFYNGHSEWIPCFENIAAIVTMILIGRFIELGIRMESAGSIRQLFGSRSGMVRMLQNGEEVMMKASELCPGMKILIRSGEKVPVDAKIVEGFVSLDEAVITGEYLPVERRAGESVIGASYVIKGYAVCEVEKKPEQSLLYQLMDEASAAMLGKKLSQIAYVEHLMAYFVPGVLFVAVFTLFLWYGFLSPGNIHKAVQSFLAVLLVACPCAMSLAVPLSVIQTIGCAARHGIFIREEGKLEQLGKIKKIVFDKTGTLTKGDIAVRSFGCSQKDCAGVLQILYETEKYSNHPIAGAIKHFTEEYKSDFCKVYDFQELEGGVTAKTKEMEVYVGHREFVQYHTGKTLQNVRDHEHGRVFFSVGETEGFFELEDTVREDAALAVGRLKKLGLAVAVMSGDKNYNVAALAERLGIEDVYGELLPGEKADMAAEWKKEQGVIMVGDGINDIPGVLKAEVGIAMGCGCDVLQEYADIIIGGSQISKIPALICLSRAMKKNIYQNLWWAFSYNAIGIIMAVTGILSPLLAGFAMAVSSVVVLLNADRMKRIGNKILENP